MTGGLPEDDALRLSAWLDGEASEADRRHVERRLASDAEAARVLDEYREVDSLVRSSARAASADGPGASVYGTIRKGFADRRSRQRRRAGGRLALPIAASIAILIGGAIWQEHRLMNRLAESQSETARFVASAMQQALESAVSGKSVEVGGENAIVSGTVTPIRTFRSTSSHWCREFRERLMIDGELIERSAIACRGDDGKWRRIETRVKGDAPLTPSLRPRI